MKHQDIRKILAERIDAVLSDASTPLPFRPYQRTTTERWGRWLEDLGGTKRAHVVHATGLGKTVVFGNWLRHGPDVRALILVPTLPLVVQTTRMISRLIGKPVGHLSSLDTITHADEKTIAAIRGCRSQSVVVATNATFKRKTHAILKEFNPHWIIVDECHWGLTPKFQTALAAFPDAVINAFTATDAFLGKAAKPGYAPVERENGQTLYGSPYRMASAHFGEELDRRTVQWGVQNGWLAPLAWGRIHLDISLDAVPLRETEYGLDYDQSALSRAMQSGWVEICRGVERMFQQNGFADRQTFSVCPSMESADILAETLWQSGSAAAYAYTGETEDRASSILMDGFAERDIGHLASVFRLREGWDAPVAEVGFILRPMQSTLFLEQTVGRLLRPLPNGSPKVALAVDIEFGGGQTRPLGIPDVFATPGSRLFEGDFLLPPPGVHEPVSPYALIGLGRERITVEKFQLDRYADTDGILSDEQGEWALPETLQGRFQLKDEQAVWTVIVRGPIHVRRVAGRRRNGRRAEFFLLSDFAASLQQHGQDDVQERS